MEKTIEHKQFLPIPQIEEKISASDLEKYYDKPNSLDIMFGQVHKVYGNEKGELPSQDFLKKYKDHSIWNIDNRPSALEAKYRKMSQEDLENEQKYFLVLTSIINKKAKNKRETKKDGSKYFKKVKIELKNGLIDGQKITDSDIDRTYYISSKVLEQALNPTVKILSKLIAEKEKEKEKERPKKESKEEKPEESKTEDKPKEEKEKEKEEKESVDIKEKLKNLEDVVKNFKNNESAILEKRYGKGILGKFHKWLETTHIGKATKIATKILGGVAVASIATTTTGGVGLVLAPLLYAGGARYAIGGAIEGLQYLIGGWKRNHLLAMQSASMNSLITQKDYIFKLEDKDKNKYADHIKELTARIKEQEKNVLNVWLSNIAKERRDKLIRAVLATVATGAFAWISGIPFGLQDLNKDGLYHSVLANNEGFSFIYRAADNVDQIRENLSFRDLGFWGIGHTLGHGLPTLGYVGLGTAAAGIAIKLARDVKQGYRDIFARGYKPSNVQTVDFSKPVNLQTDKIVETKDQKQAEMAVADKSNIREYLEVKKNSAEEVLKNYFEGNKNIIGLLSDQDKEILKKLESKYDRDKANGKIFSLDLDKLDPPTLDFIFYRLPVIVSPEENNKKESIIGKEQKERLGRIEWKDVKREKEVLAVGDLFGSMAALEGNLVSLGVITKTADGGLKWIGKDKRVVFHGDILADRQAEGIQVMNTIRRLATEAENEGGSIEILAGNHDDFFTSFLTDTIGAGNADSHKSCWYGGYIGLLELSRWGSDDLKKLDLNNFSKLPKDKQNDIWQKLLGERSEILKNMRADKEGKEFLENLCQMKLVTIIDDTLFCHTDSTTQMIKTLLQHDNIRHTANKINENYQNGLRDLLFNNKKPDNTFDMLRDGFLNTNNRDYFIDDNSLSKEEIAQLVDKLINLRINAIIHGHSDHFATHREVDGLVISSVDMSGMKNNIYKDKRSILKIDRDGVIIRGEKSTEIRK